ncbi:hypothetical protein COF64_00870 [Bacillus sp. AFS043905]|nr:hypothetical protein COF64_00870 [Bacillus sp. AFS043905]
MSVCRQKGYYRNFKTKLIGTEGTRLLREKRVQGRPRRRKGAEEAPGPPAESECLEWKSTSKYLQSESSSFAALFCMIG